MDTRSSAISRATGATSAPGVPRLFLAATLAVALHIADDNFLQPAHGTSAADHLVSGTVPLVALAAGAWTYVRVRAGVRAVIALATGFTGLVTGFLEAGYHLVSVGLYGDDYTGLLAGVAGLLLVGLAARTLWRSRRSGPSRPRRYLRRTLTGVAGVAILAEVVAPFAFGYYATHAMRATVPDPELGGSYEDVTLTTSDGLRLEGWYVPSRNGAAVIAFPGRTNPQPHARMLARHGYGVLLFDRRGEGASDGDGNRLGWGGTRDLEAALDFLEDRRDLEPGRIGGLGLSVGGELMLQVAAEDPRLAAVVSEGAGTRTLEEELVEFSPHEVIRGFHTLVAKHLGVALFANEPPPPSLVDILHRVTPRPALLIWAPHGGNRETMNPLYKRLIGPSASQWPMNDVQHIQGLQTHPTAYERRVVGFFDHALLGGAGMAPRTGK
jgi:hypothetical protein